MTVGKVKHKLYCKQKLNMESSTDAELVAVHDAMGKALWTRQFLAAQENMSVQQPHTKITVTTFEEW